MKLTPAEINAKVDAIKAALDGDAPTSRPPQEFWDLTKHIFSCLGSIAESLERIADKQKL